MGEKASLSMNYHSQSFCANLLVHWCSGGELWLDHGGSFGVLPMQALKARPV